ncbi:MAG: gamma-glutamyltransferase [Calditrichia bacterium]
MKIILIFLSIMSFTSGISLSYAREQESLKTQFYSSAGVASAHPLASQAGVAVMEQGGNSADAATAVAMALAVVYPQAGNLGGGGFLLYRDDSGRVYSLDFRESAPQGSRKDMYLQDPDKSRIGALAAGVPGTVRGFYYFHRRFGKLSWRQVLQPAIRLARDGFILNEYLARSLKNAEHKLNQFPESAAVFLQNGKAPGAGERLVQKDLARTLIAVAKGGDSEFYEGKTARRIVNTIQKYGGIITLQDLKDYRAIERAPVTIRYHGYIIYAPPLPSSAGIVLAGLFNSLKTYDLQEFPLHSPAQIALFAELEKHYFALRNQLLGDADFVDVPSKKLLNPEFAREMAQKIDFKNPRAAGQISAGKLLFPEHEETTHFSVIDKQQQAVSVTYTLNGSYGSYLVADSTGILLNNEMDDFTIQPDIPNQFGLVQGAANSIAPGKRMLSSMSPLIVTREGNLAGVLGTPGGPTIITSVLQVLTHIIDYGRPLDQAVALPRFHHQWLPDTIFMEETLYKNAGHDPLKRWGFKMKKRDSIGDVQAAWRQPGGWLFCSDPRGNGIPKGF